MYGFRHNREHRQLFMINDTHELGWDWTTDPGKATTWRSVSEALEGLQRFAKSHGTVMFVLEPVRITEMVPEPIAPEYTVEVLK